jgi:hypothetical protein
MRGRRTLGVALFVAVVLAWLPALRGGFVWDDQHDIVLSDKLHHARALADVFRHDAMWSANNVSTIATYRPLALASLALDFQLWGLRPAGFHLTSVLLHALATLALFAVFVELVDDIVAAALALLFALHPANAEAVAWINGRSEILALGFGALALRAARLRRFPSLTLFLLLALLSKETGLVFVPLAIALACIEPATPIERREKLRLEWSAPVAAAIALAAYAAMRTAALHGQAMPPRLGRTLLALPSLWVRATTTALVPLERAPVTLSSWYAALTPAARIAHVVVAVTIAALAVALFLRRRYTLVLALAWWLGALVPAAAILVVEYPWPGLARWLYIGLPGLLLTVWLSLFAQLRPPLRAACAAIVAVAWLLAAERAIAVWRSDEQLYAQMCAQSPDDPWALRALGITLLNSGHYPEALSRFRHAEEIDRTSEVHAAYGLEALTLTYLGRCGEAQQIWDTHLPTPAVTVENFRQHLEACKKGTQSR